MPEKIYIIAEAGVNHNGDIGLAYQLIDAASAAKADAVKFQMFRAEALVTTYAEQAAYQKQPEFLLVVSDNSSGNAE